MRDKLIVLFLLTATSKIHSQIAQDARQLSESLDQFSLNFLATTCEAAGDSLNLALSPYTIWMLMTIISEGARNNTAKQLEDALGISSEYLDKQRFRKQFPSLTYQLTNRNDVDLEINNEIFVKQDKSLKKEFNDIVKNYYRVEITPINFNNTAKAVESINRKIEAATRGKIRDFIVPDDVRSAEIFMTSTLFFKGKWASPFNVSDTRKEDFFDEQGAKIGEVDMMFQESQFKYGSILKDTAVAVELPYQGEKMSMVAILPKRNVPLTRVLRDLAAVPFQDTLRTIYEQSRRYTDEIVRVHLPRFKITSDLNLNGVLISMGIDDIFNENKADLQGIFEDFLYVTRVLQRADITVDEEGTTAAAAAGAGFQNKLPPPKFYANKPFAFIIYDKVTNGILFAGKISNPNAILKFK